jgi:hypothetical protein
MDHEHGEHHPGDGGPTFDMHGQLIVGEGPIYLSHLPMFMFDPKRHPHNFQVLLEVTFAPSGGDDPQATYLADRRQSGERIYTLQPANFHMIDLVAPEGGRPLLRSFTGDIVRGHFERGGTPLVRNVPVEVVRVVYFQEFQPGAQPSDLEYVLFGTPDQAFAAHVITRPPDFDQVLAVRLAGVDLDEASLRRGVRVAVPGRANAIGERLRAGERVAGEVRGVEAAQTIEVEPLTELYVEEGELGEQFSQEPTDEEIAAGMP